MISILRLITVLDTGGAELMLCKSIALSDCSWFQYVVSIMEAGPFGTMIAVLGVPVHMLDMGTYVETWHPQRIPPTAK
jgi:hypothetical protein